MESILELKSSISRNLGAQIADFQQMATRLDKNLAIEMLISSVDSCVQNYKSLFYELSTKV